MIKRPFQDSSLANPAADILANGIQSVVLDPAPECVAKLLSLAVDHIDTLLEDWWVLRLPGQSAQELQALIFILPRGGIVEVKETGEFQR